MNYICERCNNIQLIEFDQSINCNKCNYKIFKKEKSEIPNVFSCK